MKFLYGLVLLILSIQFSFAQKEIAEGNKSAPIFRFPANEFVEVDVNLEYNQEGHPVHYTSHLETDVCSDGLCKPISITIRWDLLGNFSSYHTDINNPLTKFDHVELTEEDHEKLHEILSDTSSILRDYEVEDMIDTSMQLRSFKLDAVTGATSKTFDGATVEGALYTVYTLWHFINGDIRKQLLSHTESLVSDSFVKYMLHSNNRDYTSFIFEQINEEQSNKFLSDVVGLVGNPDDYIPHFALAHLTDEDLSKHPIQYTLLSFLPKVAPHVRNALLDRFKGSELDSKGLSLLINAVTADLQGVQIDKAFDIIESNKGKIDKALKKQIQTLAVDSNAVLAKNARELLRKMN